MNRVKPGVALLALLPLTIAAPATGPPVQEPPVRISADLWADNWFAFYLGDKLVLEDPVSIETERSFNAESFEFEAPYPLQLNVILKDFKQNDSGLEYIGRRNQQMGDGGFMAQFNDAATGRSIAVSNSGWACLVVHTAPLDKTCENEADPVPGEGPCGYDILDHPTGWMDADFDDSAWSRAVEFEPSEVRPRGGYDQVEWDTEARLIWSDDLEIHNTLLCRLTVEG